MFKLNICPSDRYDFFLVIFLVILLLTNHEALYNLNTVLSFHPPFEPITVFLTITGLRPLAIFFIFRCFCTSYLTRVYSHFNVTCHETMFLFI